MYIPTEREREGAGLSFASVIRSITHGSAWGRGSEGRKVTCWIEGQGFAHSEPCTEMLSKANSVCTTSALLDRSVSLESSEGAQVDHGPGLPS